MGRVTMRRVREGEVPPSGGTAIQEEVDRPVFTGTVEVTEKDPEAHRAVMAVKSREKGGQGHANATVVFALSDAGGTLTTNAQITGKAASLGEGVTAGVLDAQTVYRD